jgi:hypothetical protein
MRPEDSPVISGSEPQNKIPRYIDDRLRRPLPPPNLCVVRGSTPVVSFGNAQCASVATLGLNPSRVEFLDKHGALWKAGIAGWPRMHRLKLRICRTRRKKRSCAFLRTATPTFRDGLIGGGSINLSR